MDEHTITVDVTVAGILDRELDYLVGALTPRHAAISIGPVRGIERDLNIRMTIEGQHALVYAVREVDAILRDMGVWHQFTRAEELVE
jgi:hypothetical protein